MRNFVLALLALTTLACALPAETLASAATVKVRVDHGGIVQTRAKKIAQLSTDKTKVEILGECRSACTMYLSLANEGLVCVGKESTYMFHAVTPLWPPTTDAGDSMTKAMVAFYPASIQQWFWKEVGLRNTSGGKHLTAEELVALSDIAIPYCE